ncbi:MAG: hypothetical protein JKY52_01430 [Flavobacteriales bacterium]|nr:hypothetical protein [Flavobacteriales bacterium]
MRRPIAILTLLIGISQPNLVHSQTTEFDTVFVKRTIGENEFEIDTLYIPGGRSSTQVLAGTTFLPYSDKMVRLMNNGLSPISLQIIQECDNTTDPKTFKDYPKFIVVKRDSSVLTIDVSVVANCCHNFLGEAEVIGKDTLNLVYTSYGGFCSCSCCFTLRYKFDTTMEDYYQVLKFVTINGSKTLGQIPKKE